MTKENSKYKKNDRISSYGIVPMSELGKLPPQAVEVEDSVLGAILLEKDSLKEVCTILKPESFYKEQNSWVFRAILELHKRNEPIDILTVTEELKKLSKLEFVGGSYYVASLTNRIASSANIAYHAVIVEQKFLSRELIRLGTEVINESYKDDSDAFEVINSLQIKIRELVTYTKNNIRNIGDIFAEMIQDIKNVQDGKLITGVLSGFHNIDKVTGGWQKGDLIVMAARPGMGKTALALALAKNPALSGIPVAIFSLEMSAKRLVARLSASEALISSTRISQSNVTHAELMAIGGRCHQLVGSPLFIDDTAGLKFSQLRAMAIKMKSDHNIQMIVIDYLQLMHGDERGNREQEISFITRNLKTLAKELDLPIIALSQLSRAVETRAGIDAKRPQLSDLRESGAIEQDADIVTFLFRPSYYGMFSEGYSYRDKILQTENLMLLDFAKGRELKIGEVPLLFYGEYMKVDNYDLDITLTLEKKKDD